VNDAGTILLAEDREDDVLLVQRAFVKGGIRNPLCVVRNGEEAIDYLSGIGQFSDRASYPFPILLLLDLKMPRMNGFEVLHWIRSQSFLSPLRVIVLTSSEDIRDVTLAYKLGANSFLVKPLDFNNTVAMAEMITDYWLRLNTAAGPQPLSTAQQATPLSQTEKPDSGD
jgi:Response regulators consisting of a CheY-like receiver domain and a winged-helix DNA-binding domain